MPSSVLWLAALLIRGTAAATRAVAGAGLSRQSCLTGLTEHSKPVVGRASLDFQIYAILPSWRHTNTSPDATHYVVHNCVGRRVIHQF